MTTKKPALIGATEAETVVISAPNFGVMELIIQGTAPLVIERFSVKADLMMKMAQEAAPATKKVRKPRDYEQEAENARYRAEDEGWEGMNAAAFRAGMISACRLANFKMTIAKLSLFIKADGADTHDGIPLTRIYGPSRTFTAHTRNATGVVDIRSRPQYRQWAAKVPVMFDRTQFSATDVINLFTRVGMQVGIGAGRPDSKSSAGCGWGTFEIVTAKDEALVCKSFGISRRA